MYKLVPKRTIKLIENMDENEELHNRKREAEFASEKDDEEWRELVCAYLEEKKILNSEKGQKFIRDLDRMLRGI